MAYETKNNSGRSFSREDDVNTNGIMLRNYQAGKFLTCSYWNSSITIEIGSIPQGAERDFSVLQKVPTIKQVMTFATMTTLDEICEEVLTSIKKTGTFSPVGAPAGANFNNLVEITDGSNLGLPKGIYLAIYKDWDNSRATNKMDVYQFSTRTVIRGYDHSTGRGQDDINKLRDFKDFALYVHEACKAFTHAQAHVIRKVEKKDNSRGVKTLFAMATAMGIDLGDTTAGAGRQRKQGDYSKKYSGSKSGYRGGSTGGYQSRYGQNQSQQPQYGSQSTDLELNIGNVSDIPIDDFV